MPEAPLAVVTGASSGIGAEFTAALTGRGYRVLAVARRADRLAALQESVGGEVHVQSLDLTAAGSVDAVAERAEELGGADLLVANAGRGMHGRFVGSDRRETQAMLQLNVLATVDLTAQLVPPMVERGTGGVIVVASSVAFYAAPYLAAYAASKAFLLSFGDALTGELDGTGVRAMTLCPGPTTTEFGSVAGMADKIDAAPGKTTPMEVVDAALRAWDAGRSLCLPGATTKVMTTAFDHLPRAVSRRMMERVFRP